VRETLFNWLGQDLSGLACLDLFAGSGALGFEAASRNAARVVMVERDREAVETLKKSRAARGPPAARSADLYRIRIACRSRWLAGAQARPGGAGELPTTAMERR
jgi:16S rRNA (guanine966-N2)-methyltransferase